MDKKYISCIILVGLVVFVCEAYFYYFSNKNEVQSNLPSVLNAEDCSVGKYAMDCNITQFLEKKLASMNRDDAKIVCSYIFLGEEGEQIYIRAMCESFYLTSKEITCSNDKDMEDCFISKKCDNCETKSIEPRLALDSGVSVPVRLTKLGNTFELTLPEEGSSYDESIKRIFPAKMITRISSSSVIDLELLNIEKVETLFNTKATFTIDKALDTSCNRTIDCPAVSGEYSILSNCPHRMNCISNKCAIGCYDFIDYETLPIRK
jgi:hypothetical protein